MKLPVGTKGCSDLKGNTLSILQQELKDVEYILNDEYSMLGQITFGWVDRRLRQITGKTDTLVENQSFSLVILVKFLLLEINHYHNFPTNEIGYQGYFNYQLFDKAVKLTVNHRVQGANQKQQNFRDILERLRTGESTKSDWEQLLTRQPSHIDNLAEFEDAIRLFFANEEVTNYNFSKLKQLCKPIAEVRARHNTKYAAKLSSDEFSGLEPVIYLAKGAKVMLTSNLWAVVGLCNGASGALVDFIYQENHKPPIYP